MKLKPINPATEEVIDELIISTKSDIEKAVCLAKESFKSWSNTLISERVRIIKKFGEILSKKKTEVAKLMSTEMGKPLVESEGEIDGALGEIGYFIHEIGRILEEEPVDVGADNVKAKILFEPIGVVGLITPWNFPIDTSLWKILPALLTGNTVLFKPSELSTLCGLKIAELLKEAGLPDDVFNVIIGEAEAGRAIVESDVDMISFTGSSATGRDILSRAGKSLKKTVLELGGSDPFIVFKDAILEQAINAAVFGRFLNCGQVCTSAKRIFVHNDIFNKFIESFVKKVKALCVGDPLASGTEIGPLVSKSQLATIEMQVKDAVMNGAKVLCGAKRLNRKGYFYEPTVLINVKENMAVLKEEVFGPVAVIAPFSSIEEAIKLANNTKYGLGASIWTQSDKLGEQMAKAIESGMIWINDFGTPYPQCPQGGIKESGIGRELSKYGILEFCNMKTVVHSKDKIIKRPWWFPYFN